MTFSFARGLSARLLILLAIVVGLSCGQQALAQNKATPGRAAQPFLGLRMANLTPELQERLQIPSPEGVDNGGAMVTAVIPGSPAELAGIPVEAVLMSINTIEVQSPSDVIREVTRAGVGAEITIKYAVFGEIQERKVRLAALPAGGMPQAKPIAPSNSSSADMRIEQLEKRIAELEQRIRLLEKQGSSAVKVGAVSN